MDRSGSRIGSAKLRSNRAEPRRPSIWHRRRVEVVSDARREQVRDRGVPHRMRRLEREAHGEVVLVDIRIDVDQGQPGRHRRSVVAVRSRFRNSARPSIAVPVRTDVVVKQVRHAQRVGHFCRRSGDAQASHTSRRRQSIRSRRRLRPPAGYRMTHIDVHTRELRPHASQHLLHLASKAPRQLVGDRALDDDVSACRHRGHEERHQRRIRSGVDERGGLERNREPQARGPGNPSTATR